MKRKSPFELEFLPSQFMIQVVVDFLKRALKQIGVVDQDRDWLGRKTRDIVGCILDRGYGNNHSRGSVSLSINYDDRGDFELQLADVAPAYSLTDILTAGDESPGGGNKSGAAFQLSCRRESNRNFCHLTGKVRFKKKKKGE